MFAKIKAFFAKIFSFFKTKETVAVADVAKVESDVKTEATTVETDVKADVEKVETEVKSV